MYLFSLWPLKPFYRHGNGGDLFGRGIVLLRTCGHNGCSLLHIYTLLFLEISSRLVCSFKHIILIFKQHYIYFYILFHSYIFSRIFFKNKTHFFKCMSHIYKWRFLVNFEVFTCFWFELWREGKGVDLFLSFFFFLCGRETRETKRCGGWVGVIFRKWELRNKDPHLINKKIK